MPCPEISYKFSTNGSWDKSDLQHTQNPSARRFICGCCCCAIANICIALTAPTTASTFLFYGAKFTYTPVISQAKIQQACLSKNWSLEFFNTPSLTAENVFHCNLPLIRAENENLKEKRINLKCSWMTSKWAFRIQGRSISKSRTKSSTYPHCNLFFKSVNKGHDWIQNIHHVQWRAPQKIKTNISRCSTGDTRKIAIYMPRNLLFMP